MNKRRLLTGVIILVLGMLCGCSEPEKKPSEETETTQETKETKETQETGRTEEAFENGEVRETFLCVKDGQLFDAAAQEEFYVVGVNMDNNTWDAQITPANRCMDQSSYAEIKAIGFNTIRFGLAFSMTLSDDFFVWLDENIQWADEAGLKIILDMHAPRGGIQLRSKQDALAFWNQENVQEEYINTWTSIAEHYKDNTCVIMYDLLNEPLVIADSEEEGVEKYLTFMQRLIREIRKVDENHVVCVEGFSVQRYDTRVNEFSYVAASSVEWQNQFEEENIIFDTHTYGPTVFTMQGEENAVSYDEVLVIVGEESRDGTEKYTKAVEEVFQWTVWESNLLKISNETVNTGVVRFMLNDVPGNTILYIDNVVVEEYDGQANFLGNVYECYFDESPYHWTEYGNGELEIVQYGSDDKGGSLCLTATKNEAEYTVKQTASSVNGMFEMKPGNYYKIKFAVNSNVTLETDMLRTDIAGYHSDFIGGLEKYSAYMTGKYTSKRANTQRAQICNEFGCNFNSMKNGGQQYLYDVVGAFYENQINFCLFAYTGKDFGLMYDSNRNFGTDQCLLRQESYDATYQALNQDMTYQHIFKNIETMCSYSGMESGQRVLVLGKEYAGIGSKYEYLVSTNAAADSIALRNGLYATPVRAVE